MDGDERYKTQGDKMEREEVRIDIAKRDMASTRAKLRRAKELRSALRQEGAPLQRTGVAKAAPDGGPQVSAAVPERRAAEARPGQTRHGAHVAVPPRHAQSKTPATRPQTSSPTPSALAGAPADKKQDARDAGPVRAPAAPQPKPSPLQTRQTAHVGARNSDAVRQHAAEHAVHAYGSTSSTAEEGREHAAARAFAQAADSIGIGVPNAQAVGEAGERRGNAQTRQVSLAEGGSPAREMELGVCAHVRAARAGWARRWALPRRFLLSCFACRPARARVMCHAACAQLALSRPTVPAGTGRCSACAARRPALLVGADVG